MSISCEIVRSKRKTAAFSITRDGRILLRIPLWVSDHEAKRLIEENQDQLHRLWNRWKTTQSAQPTYNTADIPYLKALAANKLPARLEYWSKRTGLIPTSIKITSAQSRFGSCNNRGGICFSCFLMLYPDNAIDYVIVHELCHLKHLNHSAPFYQLLSRYLPDYKQREAILKGRSN